MGIRNLDNPGRCGSDVAEFNDWPMALIINEFLDHDDVKNLHERLAFRRALLISNECQRLIKGERVNV